MSEIKTIRFICYIMMLLTLMQLIIQYKTYGKLCKILSQEGVNSHYLDAIDSRLEKNTIIIVQDEKGGK